MITTFVGEVTTRTLGDMNHESFILCKNTRVHFLASELKGKRKDPLLFFYHFKEGSMTRSCFELHLKMVAIPADHPFAATNPSPLTFRGASNVTPFGPSARIIAKLAGATGCQEGNGRKNMIEIFRSHGGLNDWLISVNMLVKLRLYSGYCKWPGSEKRETNLDCKKWNFLVEKNRFFHLGWNVRPGSHRLTNSWKPPKVDKVWKMILHDCLLGMVPVAIFGGQYSSLENFSSWAKVEEKQC